MENGDHGLLGEAEIRLMNVAEVKNRASPKSQMSRGNMMHKANRLFEVLATE